MANNTTTVNINETRQVVIEPDKPPQTRLKQYVVLHEISVNRKNYRPGENIRLTEEDAAPFVAANQLIPLEVALRNGAYPVSKESYTEKVVQAVTGENIPDTPAQVAAASTGKKSFLGNALRDAIQKKKVATNPELASTKIDAAKLAAIKAGGKNTKA